MRVLAIGLGGAGSRIVDHLYDHDRRSKVGCMSTIAIDTDANTLLQLQYLPDSAKVHFPSIDPDQHFDARSTIDLEEIMTDIQKMDTIEIDAIMIFCGAGGTMVDAISGIVPELRKAFIEPIFAVTTLPCLGEGKALSAKAADDIELIDSIVDALILFDNETWYQKIKQDLITKNDGEGRLALAAGRKDETYNNPRKIYYLLNERIARQIGLLLRAGEFNEEGLEISEVVLDAGEVLNTLKGHGKVAVGYAAEEIPVAWFDVFDRWRSAKYFIEGSQKRAARIVSLAKQAVYEDISIPCDLTSAEKALVLIAGPSNELSMKGFQTVRKWIDRSIAGLEMRSGDYPVKNTRFVGIIIMLSGLDNIPRLEELNSLRKEYHLDIEREREEKRRKTGKWIVEHIATTDEEIQSAEHILAEGTIELPRGDHEFQISDGVVILPPRKHPSSIFQTGSDGAVILHNKKARVEDDRKMTLPKPPKRTVTHITRQTDGGHRFTPRESALGVRDVNIGRHAPKGDQKDGDRVAIRTMPKARDGIIDGEAIEIQAPWKRAKNGIIDAESVLIPSPGRRTREPLEDDLSLGHTKETKENLFIHGDWQLRSSKLRAKEPDPSKRKLQIIEKEEERDRNVEPANDAENEDLFWIV